MEQVKIRLESCRMVGIFRTQKTTRTDFKMYKMIDKTTFCEVIELLRQQILFDRRIGETIQEAFGVEKKCSYKDNMAIQAIMKLLQITSSISNPILALFRYWCGRSSPCGYIL